jgi:hypothetical protein
VGQNQDGAHPVTLQAEPVGRLIAAERLAAASEKACSRCSAAARMPVSARRDGLDTALSEAWAPPYRAVS